jgi:hypothetical protein
MKKLFSSIVFVAIIGFFIAVGVQAANEASVTATVTVQNIAVSLNRTSFSYGTIASNTASSTLALWSGAGITATNDGNIISDFDIYGANTTNWTLAGTAASDAYVHKFCNDTDSDCTTPPTSYTALTTSPQTLKESIAATGGTCVFQLQLTTPNPSTIFTQQSAGVTIQASAH